MDTGSEEEEEEWFEFCIVVVEEVSNGFVHAHTRLF